MEDVLQEKDLDIGALKVQQHQDEVASYLITVE